MIRRNLGWLIIIFMAAVFVFFFLTACGTSKPATKAPAAADTSAAQVPEPGYTPGQTVDAEDYTGPAQQVANWEHEPAVFSTTAAKRECVRYKTVNGKRRCADYKTTPAKRTETDDADWYLVLADGTRVDVDAATQARYPVGAMYP
jgi:hypothetical protein